MWPTGLTLPEAEELHRHVMAGTRMLDVIAALAHVLTHIDTPWLHEGATP